MATSVMDGVNARTQLVGRNRLELLMFNLGGKQRFGINVFKVREVIKCPPLTRAPHAHHVIRGMANMRGHTISVMDLAMAIGYGGMTDLAESFCIITEYNRQVQGFVVHGVDRIVNLNWEDIKPPPNGIGNQNFLTAVTKVDDELVEIIDVEKVMADVMGYQTDISGEIMEDAEKDGFQGKHVLVVDDSSMARKQIANVLKQVDVDYTLAKNGKEAYDILLSWVKDDEVPLASRCSMVLSDVEMPEMDGYTLTKHIKEHPELNQLYVMLHSSLSGSFNENMVKKVGANDFLAKYNPDDLAKRLLDFLQGDNNSLATDKAA